MPGDDEGGYVAEEISTLGANVQRSSVAAAGSSKEHGDAQAKANEISLALRGQGQMKIGHVEDWVALLLCVSILAIFPLLRTQFYLISFYFFTLLFIR